MLGREIFALAGGGVSSKICCEGRRTKYPLGFCCQICGELKMRENMKEAMLPIDIAPRVRPRRRLRSRIVPCPSQRRHHHRFREIKDRARASHRVIDPAAKWLISMALVKRLAYAFDEQLPRPPPILDSQDAHSGLGTEITGIL